MSRVLIACGLALLGAGVLPAQSVPPIMKPKETAARAVAATNAHTESMTTEPGATPVQGTPRQAATSDSARPIAGARATQTAAGSTAVPRAVERASFEREIYNYTPGGRRDPFVSLMANGDLRPVITDLVVVGIVFDEAGSNSIAVLRDVSAKEKVQYRVHVGQSLGRMRVARIDPKSVTFTIEEFGFSRQETLALNDSKQARKQ